MSKSDILIKLFENSLFSDISKEVFLNDYWKTQLLTSSFDLDQLNFSFSEYHDWLKFGFLSSHDVHLFKNGKQLQNASFMKRYSETLKLGPSQDLGLDNHRVLRVIQQGASVKSSRHSQTSMPFQRIVNAFANIFDSRITLNSYYTPAGGKCFIHHQDTYDIFVIQLEGSKKWFVESKNRYQGRLVDLEMSVEVERNDDDKSFILKAGEVLYLPACIAHSAEALDEESLHITVGIHPRKLEDELELAIGKLKRSDPANLTIKEGNFKAKFSQKTLLDLMLCLKENFKD